VIVRAHPDIDTPALPASIPTNVRRLIMISACSRYEMKYPLTTRKGDPGPSNEGGLANHHEDIRRVVPDSRAVKAVPDDVIVLRYVGG